MPADYLPTLFRVPQCRPIGDHWYHEDDFSVLCDDGFLAEIIFSIILIILVPIGVPVALFYSMKKQKDELGGVGITVLGGAKLSPDDVDDEDDQYGFLTRDLKPEFWYCKLFIVLAHPSQKIKFWRLNYLSADIVYGAHSADEIVTYSRKLVLGGLSIVVGRGTMAQAYFVGAVEALYLMHHMRSFPYVLLKHNIVDGFGHCAVILTYMVTLILRNAEGDDGFDGEWFPRDG